MEIYFLLPWYFNVKWQGQVEQTLFHTLIQGLRAFHLEAPFPTLGPQGPLHSNRERKQGSQVGGYNGPGLEMAPITFAHVLLSKSQS